MSAVKESLATFFEQQRTANCPHEFSLASFNDVGQVHVKAKSAKQAKEFAAHLDFVARLGTYFTEGLMAVRKILSDSALSPAFTPHLIIFSDGRPADCGKMIQTTQDLLDEFPALRIHAIGFGDGLDFNLLQQLTSIGRGAFALSSRSIAALDTAFASLTSTITATQTVTSGSNKSSNFSFRAGKALSKEGDGAVLPQKKLHPETFRLRSCRSIHLEY